MPHSLKWPTDRVAKSDIRYTFLPSIDRYSNRKSYEAAFLSTTKDERPAPMSADPFVQLVARLRK